MTNKKLIRLTTSSKEGIFSNNFSDEIVIYENSEIALHSLSMIRPAGQIEIDGSNSLFQFKVQEESSGVGGFHNVIADNGVFSSTNYDTLLTDLQNGINNALDILAIKENGMECDINGESKDKLAVIFRQSLFHQVARHPHLFTFQGISRSVTDDKLRKTDTGATTNYKTAVVFSNDQFIEGAGCLRARIRNFVIDGGNENGFCLGLVEDDNYDKLVDPSQDFVLADASYIVQTPKLPTDPYRFKQEGENTLTDSSLDPLKFASGTHAINQHDILEISLNKGKIEGRVYQDGATTILFSQSFDRGNKRYYPFISMFNDVDHIEIDHVRTHLSPFDELGQLKEKHIGNFNATLEVTAPTPPIPNEFNSTFDIKFGAISLANFMGYNTTNPESVFGNLEATFNANNIFDSANGSAIYMVDMLNLELESYDGFKDGRKNILAVIPANERNTGNQDFVLQYEPSNLNYISLRNKFKVSLRNIRARVVNSDFSPILTSGLSSLTVLIRKHTHE